MTIKNPDKYCAELWDWACLDGCFGNTNIRVSDGDGITERNGYFIYFEMKSPGVKIPTGQDIMFKSLVATGYFTVMVVWGHPGRPEEIELRTSQTTIRYEHADLTKFRKIVSSWFSWAENQTPAPKFEV